MQIKRLAWFIPLMFRMAGTFAAAGMVGVVGTPAAHAMGSGYGMAGCGLGSLVIESPGKFEQVLAATVNATSASQSFGISSGTSNCLSRKDSAQLQKQEAFVATNLVTLQKEMAQGGGDAVTGLGEVLGCQEQILPEVSQHLVGAYEQIFSQPGVAGVLGAAKKELRQTPALAAGCASLFG